LNDATEGTGFGSPSRGPAEVQGHRRVRLLVAGAVIVTIVTLDQITKSLAVAHLTHPEHVLGPFGLDLGYNAGSAFSVFNGPPVVLGIVGALVIAVLCGLLWRSTSMLFAVGIGLVLGGALGNLGDRAFRGHGGAVVDFITLTHWPTFNVADSAITVGVVVLVIYSFFFGPRERHAP
jgi:signal peptidase II